MYRQIEVHPHDRDLQRILWRENSNDEIAEFRLNTITYGLACVPFLALRTFRQLADDEEENKKYPLGAATLQRDVYMDDVSTGASTIAETKQLQQQLICKAGGFPLKK